MTAGSARSGILFWAAVTFTAIAWIVNLGMAAMGMTVHWPSWLTLAANTGTLAVSTPVRTSSRSYGPLVLAMAILGIVAAIGVSGTRH